MLAMIVDGLIVVLLLALLAFGVALRRNLARLRGPGGELRELIDALDGATARAEGVLAEFKRKAFESAAAVKSERDQMTALADDLRLLIGRAEREADRLAELISRARTADAGAIRPGRPDAPVVGPNHHQAELERTLRSLR